MSGREREIRELYEKLGPALLGYARSLVGDAGEAEDSLQQVFLNVMKRPEVPSDPRPYLFRAVRNDCLNRRRSALRETARREAAASIFTAPSDLERLELDLERALADLQEQQREVVMLRVWGELTLAQAAQVLDIPPNTVASRYRYALAALRRHFQAQLRT